MKLIRALILMTATLTALNSYGNGHSKGSARTGIASASQPCENNASSIERFANTNAWANAIRNVSPQTKDTGGR